MYAFIDATLRYNKFTLVPGLRVDHFQFGYVDDLSETYTNLQAKKTRISPKLSLLYDHNEDVQFFVKIRIRIPFQ